MSTFAKSPFAEKLLAKERTHVSNLAKIERLMQENQVLTAEINLLREMREMMGGEHVESIAAPKSPIKTRQPRNIHISDEWVAILGLAGDGMKEFGYDDIVAAGAMRGIEIKKASARVQIMKYVQNGIVDRRADGRFVLTDRGASSALVVPAEVKMDPADEAGSIPQEIE